MYFNTNPYAHRILPRKESKMRTLTNYSFASSLIVLLLTFFSMDIANSSVVCADYQSCRMAGVKAESDGDLIAAKAYYEKAELAAPTQRGKAICANSLGLLALKAHDPQGAVDNLRRSTSLDSGSKLAWNNLGNALIALHESGQGGKELIEEATNAFKKAGEIDPSYRPGDLAVNYLLSNRKTMRSGTASTTNVSEEQPLIVVLNNKYAGSLQTTMTRIGIKVSTLEQPCVTDDCLLGAGVKGVITLVTDNPPALNGLIRTTFTAKKVGSTDTLTLKAVDIDEEGGVKKVLEAAKQDINVARVRKYFGLSESIPEASSEVVANSEVINTKARMAIEKIKRNCPLEEVRNSYIKVVGAEVFETWEWKTQVLYDGTTKVIAQGTRRTDYGAAHDIESFWIVDTDGNIKPGDHVEQTVKRGYLPDKCLCQETK